MPRRPTRRFPTVLAAAALAGALAVTGCAEESAAIRVGDQTLSDKDLIDEVSALYGNTAFWEQLDQQSGQPAGTTQEGYTGDAPGSFSQQFVARVIQQRVALMLVDELWDEEGGEVTPEHRDQAVQEQSRSFGPAFAEFPQSYQDQLIDDFSRLASLQEELGEDGFGEAYSRLIEETDVEISPRYGTWDSAIYRNAPDQSPIVPPEGPAIPPGEGTGIDGFEDLEGLG